MNILLSCVGRRSYLVEYFKEAIKSNDGKVIGTNSEAFTSGMLACDKSYVVPHVNDAEYIPTLLKIAKDEDVSMVISLFDIDLPYLAKAKELFKKNGIEIIISSEEVIDISNDKLHTYYFLKNNEFNTPVTLTTLEEAIHLLNNNDLIYPLFVKPRFGMGSIGVYKADNINELTFFYIYVQKQIRESYLYKLSSENLDSMVLIQESILGKEFGIDILNDLEGNYVMSVAKEKLAMRSGETDISIVIENKQLSELSEKLSRKLGHIGNLDLDVLFDGNTYYILELNARFGGGFPFSYLAGADFPNMLIEMVKKNKITIPKIDIGTKCFKSISPMKAKNGLKFTKPIFNINNPIFGEK